MLVKNYSKNKSNLLTELGINQRTIIRFHKLYDQCPYLSHFQLSVEKHNKNQFMIEISVSSFDIKFYQFEISKDINIGFETVTNDLMLQLNIWKKDRFRNTVQLGA